MNLNIARPNVVVNSNLGIEKVRTGARVELALVDDRDTPTVTGRHLRLVPEAKSPNILHQLFHWRDRSIFKGSNSGKNMVYTTKLAILSRKE
jgi:hypothetical protein